MGSNWAAVKDGDVVTNGLFMRHLFFLLFPLLLLLRASFIYRYPFSFSSSIFYFPRLLPFFLLHAILGSLVYVH